jgi:peptide/nickel transport system permease protein
MCPTGGSPNETAGLSGFVTAYVLRRTLIGLLIVWGVYTVTFFAVNLSPGDPFSDMLGDPQTDRADMERLRALWGYDRPVHERYFVHLRNMFWSESSGLTFDLGFSFARKSPIGDFLLVPLRNTLLLTGAAFVIDFVLGIGIGALSAARRGSPLDRRLTTASLVIYSMPAFWIAIVLVFLFGVCWQVFPTSGMNTPGLTWNADLAGFVDFLHHLTLPALILGIGGAAATGRFQRASMIDALGQDYVRTARAKGLDERSVIVKHALPNSLAPTITLLGLSLPFLVSGSVIIESIFAWPGMGRELLDAVAGKDDLLVTAIVLVSSIVVVAGNLVADILYSVVDPRVRLR